MQSSARNLPLYLWVLSFFAAFGGVMAAWSLNISPLLMMLVTVGGLALMFVTYKFGIERSLSSR